VASFIFALLFVFAVAIAVVAVFALPHLRAGSPLLTPKGEQVAREAQTRIRSVGRAGSAAVEAARAKLVRPGSGSDTDTSAVDALGGVAQAGPGTGGTGPGVAEPGALLIQKQRIAAPARSAPTTAPVARR
jgi:hypothetical protein